MPKTIVKDLAGIMYGVSPDRGMEVLFGKIIVTLINQNKSDKIQGIEQNNRRAFWFTLDALVRSGQIKEIPHYSHVLYHAFKGHPDSFKNLENYINHITSILSSDTYGLWSIKTDGEKYTSMALLLDSFGKLNNEIWDNAISTINEEINNSDKLIYQMVDFYWETVKQFNNYDFGICKLTIDSFAKWILLIDYAEEQEIPLYDLLCPQDDIQSILLQQIKNNALIPGGVSKIFGYAVRSGLGYKFDNLLVKIKEYSQSSQNQFIDKTLCELLALLYVFEKNSHEVIGSIYNNGDFFHKYLNHDKEPIKYLLFALIHSMDFWTYNVPAVGNSAANLKSIRDYWGVSHKEDVINSLVAYIELLKSYDLVWVLAKDDRNVLAMDILKYAVQNNTDRFFDLNNKIAKLNGLFLGYVDSSFKETGVIEKLISFGIINEYSEQLDILEYDHSINLLLDYDVSPEFCGKIELSLLKIEREQWASAFENFTCIFDIVKKVRNTNSEFVLEIKFIQGLLDFIKKSIVPDAKPLSKSQVDKIKSFQEYTSESFISHLKVKLTEHIIEIGFLCNSSNLRLIEELIVYPEVWANKTIFDKFIVDTISEKSEYIFVLFQIVEKHKGVYKLNKNQKEILKTPLSELIEECDEQYLEMIRNLCIKLGFDSLIKEKENTGEIEAEEENTTEIT